MKDYSYIAKFDKIAAEIEKSPNSPLERFLSREYFLQFYHGYGLPLSHIARGIGVHVNRVHRLRKKYGIQSTHKHETTKRCIEPYVFRGNYGPLRKKISVEGLKKKYLIEKKSMGDIAKEFGVSRTAVLKYLKDCGIQTRSKRKARILAMERGKVTQHACTIDEHFFSRWSKEMAWVLGLYLTDGCITEESFGQNRVSIYLIDKDVIEKIRVQLRSTHTVSVSKRKGVLPQYGLSFVSSRVYGDLVRLGVTPRKSTTVKMSQVPLQFLPDFARGVFEGDGNYGYEGPVRSLKLRLTSGSRRFIHEFAEGLAKMGLTRRTPYERKDGKSFELRYGTAADCRLYYELAYKNTPTSLSMDRKRKIIEKWYNG